MLQDYGTHYASIKWARESVQMVISSSIPGTTPEVFIHENGRHRIMLLRQEAVQDNIGVNTMRPLVYRTLSL